MDQTRKGYRILLTMFEITKTMTRRSDRECFNQIVRFLADCARIHPMPEEDHAVADRLIPMARPLLEAWYEEPYDYLGQLFSEKDCAIEGMGQLLTPLSVVSYINDTTMGLAEEDKGEDEEERWKLVLDPATGTGRFLLDLAWHHRDKKLALFGVELDPDLYRACLVNMRLYALGMPYFILRANTLMVDLRPGSPNWRLANRWDPPDWETMVTPTGETYAQWEAEHAVEAPPERARAAYPERGRERQGGSEMARQGVNPCVQTTAEHLPLFGGLEE